MPPIIATRAVFIVRMSCDVSVTKLFSLVDVHTVPVLWGKVTRNHDSLQSWKELRRTVGRRKLRWE